MGRKRGRVTKAGGVTFYPEQKDTRSQGSIRGAFLEAYPESLPIQADIPIKLSIKMWHPCPKSIGKKRRLASWMRPVVTTKPDVSNVVRQVEDALSKYAYVDDKQITWLSDVMLFYAIDREGNDTKPRMLITVEEL
jgi:Holliday junction resolvase RusA-like endonuclease